MAPTHLPAFCFYSFSIAEPHQAGVAHHAAGLGPANLLGQGPRDRPALVDTPSVRLVLRWASLVLDCTAKGHPRCPRGSAEPGALAGYVHTAPAAGDVASEAFAAALALRFRTILNFIKVAFGDPMSIIVDLEAEPPSLSESGIGTAAAAAASAA